MKKQYFLLSLLGFVLLGVASVKAEEDSANLLKNSSFEQYEEQSAGMFGNYTEFEEWNRSGGFCTNLETSDVYDGTAAMKLGAATAATVYQEVTGLTEAYYEDSALFRLTIHYKAVTVKNGGNILLDAYWEHKTIIDGLKSHDASKLQRVLSDTVQSEWQSLVIETTRPQNAKSFMLQFKASSNSYVLVDSVSFEAVAQTTDEPFITVLPKTLSSVSCEIGQSVDFQTVHITHGNVQGNTTFELSYTDADQFRLSRSALAADESEGEIVITYSPTSAGTHIAYLNIDNLQHPQLHQSIKLTASCTDPSAVPSITVTPNVLPDFEAVAGRQHKQRVRVKSENCTDFVYVRVDHIEGAGFTIDGTMLSKNYESEVEITFSPMTAGSYRSTLTIYSIINEFAPVVVALNGVGKEASEETIDWLTDFVWDESAPLTLLEEHFDEVSHNETLVLEGWQNVAAADERPWWGFDEAKTSPVRGDGKYAKATAYQYQKDSTGMWEMWLVTPALDYKNAEGKIFAFSVMGEYMPEEDNPASLEIVYIDATDAEHVFFQVFDGISIPQTSDENNIWVPFHINLENQPNMDIFHIGFRFVGPNGTAGGVTYYIDDVSWGRTDLQGINVEKVQGDEVQCTKVIENGVLYLLYKGTKYNVQGKRVGN